jgi:hypothetical protein
MIIIFAVVVVVVVFNFINAVFIDGAILCLSWFIEDRLIISFRIHM